MRFVDVADIAVGFVPLDLQTQRDGVWVNLEKKEKLIILLCTGTGTDGDDPVVTVQQASDSSGTGAKALNFTKVWRKQAADAAAVSVFTETTQVAAETYTNTDAHLQFLWVLDIDGDSLDTANSFNHVRVTFNDTGINAKLGVALYIVLNNKDMIDNPNHISNQSLKQEFTDVLVDKHLNRESSFSVMAGGANSVKSHGATTLKV